MAGADGVDESQLKGMSRYFNSQTTTGRANVAKATIGVTALFVAYLMLKPKSKK